MNRVAHCRKGFEDLEANGSQSDTAYLNPQAKPFDEQESDESSSSQHISIENGNNSRIPLVGR